jgi:hypothetical protein
MQSKSRDCYSSRPVHHVSRSMVSRICRVAMDREGLRLRRLVSPTNCRSLILGMSICFAPIPRCCVLTLRPVSTVSIYHRTRRSRRSIRNSPLLSRKRSGSARSRQRHCQHTNRVGGRMGGTVRVWEARSMRPDGKQCTKQHAKEWSVSFLYSRTACSQGTIKEKSGLLVRWERGERFIGVMLGLGFV